ERRAALGGDSARAASGGPGELRRYTAAQPNRRTDDEIGASTSPSPGDAVQSASTNRAPIWFTIQRVWVAGIVPSNSFWASSALQLHPGSDHRQSPTNVRRPVSPGTTAPR